MKHPKLATVLSAMLGSTAAFLVLSRWGLAGTVTGAILMPVIFTLVSFWSHESIERAGSWIVCRFKKDSVPKPVKTEDTEETPAYERLGWRARSLQWTVVVIAFFAFAVSLYSLTHEPEAGVTVLREKVIETVTVTTERSTLSVAKNTAQVPTATDASQADGVQATTTTSTTTPLPQVSETESTVTTDSSVPDPVTSTSLP